VDDTSLLIAYSAALYEWKMSGKGRSPPEIDGWNLEDLVRDISEVLAKIYGDQHQAHPSEIAGYLEVRHRQGTLFIPFNLVQSFPSSEALRELIDQGERIRFSESNIICISGSATYLGAPLPLGDLDYCEYFDRSDAQIIERVERIFTEDGGSPYCASVKWDEIPRSLREDSEGQVQRVRPWSDPDGLVGAARFAQGQGGFKKGQILKADYVADCGMFTLMPISNVAIPVDPAEAEQWAAGLSHTAQEVGLVPTGRRPQILALESGLGYYAVWLRGQIDEQAAKPVKAAKRALSLTSLFLMRDRSDEIIEALQQEELASLTRRSALSDVIDLTRSADDEAGIRLREAAEAALAEAGGAPKLSDYREVNKKCAIASRKAVEEIDEILDTARDALAGMVR
jgi:hypothetical protein